jgi:WD40 repeat protein
LKNTTYSTAARLALGLALAIVAVSQEVPHRALIPAKPIGSGDVRQLSYSPDGRFLAVVTTIGFQVRRADDGTLLNTVVDDLPASPRLHYYPEPWLNELCWSPDGTRIARASVGIEIWDPLASAPERILPVEATDKAFHELAWSSKGRWLAARSDSGIVVLGLDGARLLVIPGELPGVMGRTISGFSWAPDGGQLAVVTGQGESEEIEVWDVMKQLRVRRFRVGQKAPKMRTVSDTGQVVEIPPNHAKVEWSPDGHLLALASGFSGLSLWNPYTGSSILRTQRKMGLDAIGAVISLSWSRGGNILRVGTPFDIRMLKLDSGVAVHEVRTESKKKWMRSIAVSVDGEQLAGSFDNGEIVMWRGRNHIPVVRLSIGAFADGFVVLSPDLRYMVGASPQGWAAVWDLSSCQKVIELGTSPWWGHDEYAWSPDGRTLAAVNGGELPNVVHLFQPSALEGVRSIKMPYSNYSAYTEASWSPDGTRVLVSGPPYAVISVKSGDVESLPSGQGRLLWTAEGGLARRPVPVRAVLQSPDFRYVAIGGNDKILVWDTQENRALGTVDFPPPRTLSQVAWSPDSGKLAYVSKTGALEIWDRGSGTVVEQWTTPGIWTWKVPTFVSWHEKLVAVECLGGAIRFWRAHD